MSEILFIGGPWDGRREAIQDDLSWFDIPIEDRIIRYKRVHLAGHSKKFELFVISHMSGDNLMEWLLLSYRGGVPQE